jgi:biotin synthase-like enzyme
MYLAGANGTMTGNYLTTGGRNPEIDRREIEDLALAVLSPDGLPEGRDEEERRRRIKDAGRRGGRNHPG